MTILLYFTISNFTPNNLIMHTSLPMRKNYPSFPAIRFSFHRRMLFVLPLLMVLMGSNYPTADHTTAALPSMKKPVIFSATFITTLQISGIPPIQTARSSGGGIAMHLGKSYFEGNSTVNFTVQPAQLNGTATITAANGDEFYTSFTGTTTTANGQAIGNFVHHVTGGTGRFADINGLLRATSSHSLATQTGTLSFEGEIDY